MEKAKGLTFVIPGYELREGCVYLIVYVAKHRGKMLRKLGSDNGDMTRVLLELMAKNIRNACKLWPQSRHFREHGRERGKTAPRQPHQ